MNYHVVAALFVALSACTRTGGPDVTDATVLAIGDSIMEWNIEAGASIPDVVGEQLHVGVVNASVSGARVLDEDEPIADQYREGSWGWVIMDGGGNDLNDQCACGDCDDVMDQLVSDGLEGAIPDLIEKVTDQGLKVAFLGYYDLPDDADFGFDRCGDELVTLSDRMSRFAESNGAVIFVDGRQAFGRTDRQHYDEDRVHPSVQGSEAVGRLIAEAIGDL
jgi:acyl-CoA thioesterase-1